MSYDAEIMAEIKARGKDPSRLSPAEFAEISLKVRSPADRLKASVEAAKSYLKTRVFSVPLSVYWERREKCESNACGKFVTLQGDAAACLMCGCGGALLEDAKWWDGDQECPMKEWGKHGS